MKVVSVLPTYNERDNITRTVEGLIAASARMSHEYAILVVDDNSPDGTQDVVRELQSRHGNVRMITGTKQGLGVAYARGIEHAISALGADVVITMDSDASHDPAIMPSLVAKIDEGYDLAVGARYVEGGRLSSEWGWHRKVISRVANAGIRFIAGVTQINDCTSGYRAYRASMLRDVDLQAIPRGYAALTYLAYQSLMAGARPVEVPITFANRAEGDSKLRASDAIELFLNAWWIRYDRRERFLRRASGGLSGVAVNLGALAILHHLAGAPANMSSLIAIEASVLFSFAWRSIWGVALGRRAASPLRALIATQIWGLPSFAITFAVFFALHTLGVTPLLAQLLGIIPAMIWNYFIGDRLFGMIRGDRPQPTEPQRDDTWSTAPVDGNERA